MHEEILETANVRRRGQHVYCIGPFAERVSFAAQQQRALNLVWALKQKHLLSEGTRVAVVGGGIAGLTAALGLGLVGCAVDVFEKGMQKMPRQRDSEHRLVHPTINLWPQVELSLTTRLPFLEWFCSDCTIAVGTIERQFEKIAKTCRIDVFERIEVTEILPPIRGKVALSLQPVVPSVPLPAPETEYSLVILAIGFGREEPLPGFPDPDYWMPDSLEHRRSNEVHKKFIVSGCGDGGLIDTLRIVHLNFAKGKLALKIAAALSKTPMAQAIADAEMAARPLAQATDHLESAYEKAVDDLVAEPDYTGVRTLMDESLVGAGFEVRLVDKKLTAPYSRNAAPIHKLLLAHAKFKRRVIFHQGEVAHSKVDTVVAGRAVCPRDRSHVIVRHGATAQFKFLLSDAELDELRADQKPLRNFHIDPYWNPSFWPHGRVAMSGWPVYDVRDATFISHRRDIAEEAMHEHFPESNVSVGAREDHFLVAYTNLAPHPAPAELFGIEVRMSTRPYRVFL